MRIILPLLLFSKLFANITCNWICEIASKMNAGIPCNPDGIFFCNGKYNNVWTEPVRAVVFPAFDEIVCSLLCMSNQCLCMQYLGEEGCVLLFTAKSEKSVSSVFLNTGTTNVALNKPTFSSSPEMNLRRYMVSSFAVDGDIDVAENFFVSAGSKTWMLVDLEQKYKIKEIRAMPRQDVFLTDRFVGVAILVGNHMVTDGDFSNYVTVAEVNTAHTSLGQWVMVRSRLSGTYQYVALQRLDTIGYNSTDAAELEVYA